MCLVDVSFVGLLLLPLPVATGVFDVYTNR